MSCPARRAMSCPARRVMSCPARRVMSCPARRAMLCPARRVMSCPARRVMSCPARRAMSCPARRAMSCPVSRVCHLQPRPQACLPCSTQRVHCVILYASSNVHKVSLPSLIHTQPIHHVMYPPHNLHTLPTCRTRTGRYCPEQSVVFA